MEWRRASPGHDVRLTVTGLAWLGEAVDRLAGLRVEKCRLDTA